MRCVGGGGRRAVSGLLRGGEGRRRGGRRRGRAGGRAAGREGGALGGRPPLRTFCRRLLNHTKRPPCATSVPSTSISIW